MVGRLVLGLLARGYFWTRKVHEYVLCPCYLANLEQNIHYGTIYIRLSMSCDKGLTT